MFWLWTETVMKHRCIYVKLHNFSLYKQLMRCTSLSLSLSWAVNVPVVFAEPLQMGVAPCSARSYWMRWGWACTSASCATWPMRFCHARRTADGTSIRADSVLLLCSWPSLPLYRYTSPSSVWLFLLSVALWGLQISTFDSSFISTPVTRMKFLSKVFGYG